VTTSGTYTREEKSISTRTDEQGGGPDDGSASPIDAEAFREAMAQWASTVTVVAVRDPDDGRVRATTVSSFAPVSAEPPEVVVSLNANAQVLPFVREGRPMGISLLAEDQRRWARVFADSFPVGPMPWGDDGIPTIAGSIVALECDVRAIHATEGGSRLVIARVVRLAPDGAEEPLLYWRRGYHGVGGG
jgi:flavin reductase (DIM6/NTAB) family NADH-FMN oxidoreductase RutF